MANGSQRDLWLWSVTIEIINSGQPIKNLLIVFDIGNFFFHKGVQPAICSFFLSPPPGARSSYAALLIRMLIFVLSV